jgi:hypothetical protein
VVTKGGVNKRIYLWKQLGMEPKCGDQTERQTGGDGEKFTDNYFDV